MEIRYDKLRLAIILPTYFEQAIGGAEIQTKFIVQAALHAGYEVNYLFIASNDDFQGMDGLRLHVVKENKLWLKLGNITYPYAFSFKKILDKIKPDVIYQRCGLALTGLSAHYGLGHGIRSVFHIAHDKDLMPGPIPLHEPYRIPEKLVMQYGIKKVDAVIAQTNFQAGLLKKTYGRDASAVISNGHPLPRGSMKSVQEIRVLWIANWKPMKQPEVFVKLVQELNEVRNVQWTMIGRYVGYQELIDKAIANNVVVTGGISNEAVNELLEKSHILVNTSRQEGLSNTFIQAWMRRVPVASLQVDPDDVIKKEGLGYCSGSIGQLVKDTRRLIEDQDLRESMGTKARNYAAANYSLNNINKILEILEG